jgi:hypothetical protein
MNLTGLQHRLATFGWGQKGGENLAVVFKSRPVSIEPSRLMPRMTMRARTIGYRRPFLDGPSWQVSVEVQAAESGALLRRIKILITDEARIESAENTEV